MSDDFIGNAGWANSSFKADNTGNLIVLFHTVQKHMKKASLEQNRPVFKEVVHITKIVPGDSKLVIDRPVRESDMEEYADKWAHWKATNQNKSLGIPIEHWHAISDTQKAEFKAMKIHTVEQFAELSDGILMNIMGGTELRRKAQVFIESGKDAELVSKIKAESQAQISALETQMAEMRALLDEMTAPKKSKEKVVA